MLTRRRINVKRERKVSQGDERKERGEARQEACRFFTSLRRYMGYVYVREIHTLVIDTTFSIVKFMDR